MRLLRVEHFNLGSMLLSSTSYLGPPVSCVRKVIRVKAWGEIVLSIHFKDGKLSHTKIGLVPKVERHWLLIWKPPPSGYP